MEQHVKYEDLYQSLKTEIQGYIDLHKGPAKGPTNEQLISSWFDENFAQWLDTLHILNADHKKKRKDVRFEIELPVKIVEVLIESQNAAMELEFVGTIVNISRGGLYFKSSEQFSLSSIIKVQIDFSDIDKKLGQIEALAMVIRMEKISDRDYGVGVIFSSIYDNNKKNLDLFIFKQLIYHIHSR